MGSRINHFPIIQFFFMILTAKKNCMMNSSLAENLISFKKLKKMLNLFANLVERTFRLCWRVMIKSSQKEEIKRFTVIKEPEIPVEKRYMVKLQGKIKSP